MTPRVDGFAHFQQLVLYIAQAWKKIRTLHKLRKQKNGLMQRVRRKSKTSRFWERHRSVGMRNECLPSLEVSRFTRTETQRSVVPVFSVSHIKQLLSLASLPLPFQQWHCIAAEHVFFSSFDTLNSTARMTRTFIQQH